MINTIKFWINPSEFLKSAKGKSRLQSWAKKVYKRLNHTCDKCGYKAGGDMALEAHHLNAKAWFPKQAFRLSNGVCLCEKCHKDFHNKMGGTRVKCTKEDYLKWRNKRNKDINIGFNIFMGLIIVVFIVLILEGLGVIG